MSSNHILGVSNWNPSAVRYMQPRVNEQGGKRITVVSTQTNRAPWITTPSLMTWGISDFTNEKTGESDGKFNLTLHFPNTDNTTDEIDTFYDKLTEFEDRLIDDAAQYSEAWFGKKRSKETLKDTFNPIIKSPNDRLTNKNKDYTQTKIKVAVPNYDGDWKGVEVYDSNDILLFPSTSNDNLTPIDLVPGQSIIECIIKSKGIWIAGGNWGISWSLYQCKVIKSTNKSPPPGKCLIPSSKSNIKQVADSGVVNEDEVFESTVFESTSSNKKDTTVEDSDDEEPAPTPAPKKKVVKKAAPPPEDDTEEEPAPAPKKKVVKKKASA